MKKFLSLLALVIMSCMGAWAQAPLNWNNQGVLKVSPAMKDGEFARGTVFYKIQNKAAGTGCLRATSTIVTTTGTDNSDNEAQWAIIGNNQDGFQFVNRSTKKAICMQERTNDSNTSVNQTYANDGTLAELTAENTRYAITRHVKNDLALTGYFVIASNTSKHSFWNRNGANLRYWYSHDDYGYYKWQKTASSSSSEWSGDDGSSWKFVEVESTIPAVANLDGYKVSIKNKQHGYYIGHNNSTVVGAYVKSDENKTTWELVATESKFYLKNGNYYIKSMPTTHDTQCEMTTEVSEAEKFTIELNSSKFYTLRMTSTCSSCSNDHSFMHGVDWSSNNSKPVPLTIVRWDGSANASQWTFDVEEQPDIVVPTVDVTYHVKNAYNETFDVVVQGVEVGSEATAPTFEYFSNAVIEGDNHVVAADNKEFIVAGTWSFPFQEGKFYQIKNRNQNYLKNIDANNISTKNAADNNSADMLWYFQHVANTQNQYTIHSVSTETAWSGTSGKMALSTTATPFQILQKDTYFNIFSGNPNGYVGAHSNYTDANSAVGYWWGGYANEHGSQWSVFEFDESTLAALNLTNGAEGYVGTFTGDTRDALTAANAYMTNKTAANLRTALESCSGEVERITIDPNKFYQLISQDTNTNKGRVVYSPAYCGTDGTSSQYGDRDLKIGTVGTSTTFLNSAFKFTKSGGGWIIQHANSNYYVVRLNAINNLGHPDLPIGSGNAGNYLLHNIPGQPSDIWVLNNDNATDRYLHCGEEGEGRQLYCIHTTTPATNNGLRWKIKEITEVPVTIGTVGYTTVCFPMAVTIPDDVTAYKVTEETDEKMMLEAVTGNVAAKTPLIIEKENGGDVVFPVAEYGESLGTQNMLLGTTARRIGFAADSFYALAADNNAKNGVSFKINGSVSAIPANKAYLPVSTAGSNKALFFDFAEDTLTNINTVETLEPAADALYNINGQRVVAPTRGIYVKANGQKVFIK